jgi:hypothetical protein
MEKEVIPRYWWTTTPYTGRCPPQHHNPLCPRKAVPSKGQTRRRRRGASILLTRVINLLCHQNGAKMSLKIFYKKYFFIYFNFYYIKNQKNKN